MGNTQNTSHWLTVYIAKIDKWLCIPLVPIHFSQHKKMTEQNTWNNSFQILDNRQCRTVLLRKRKQMSWDYSATVSALWHFLNHSVEKRSPNMRQTSHWDEGVETCVRRLRYLQFMGHKNAEEEPHKKRVPEICLRVLLNLWQNISWKNHKGTPRGQTWTIVGEIATTRKL